MVWTIKDNYIWGWGWCQWQSYSFTYGWNYKNSKMLIVKMGDGYGGRVGWWGRVPHTTCVYTSDTFEMFCNVLLSKLENVYILNLQRWIISLMLRFILISRAKNNTPCVLLTCTAVSLKCPRLYTYQQDYEYPS